MPPEFEELYGILGEMLEKRFEAEKRLGNFPVFRKGLIEGLIDILCNERKENAYREYVYPFGIRKRAGELLVLKIGQYSQGLAGVSDIKIILDFRALFLTILSAFSESQK